MVYNTFLSVISYQQTVNSYRSTIRTQSFASCCCNKLAAHPHTHTSRTLPYVGSFHVLRMSPAERNLCRTGLSLCIMPGMGQGMASAQDETTKTTTKDLCRAEPTSTNEQTTTICVLYMALFSMFSLRYPPPLYPPAYTPPSSCS